MPEEIVMPRLSDTMQEGTIARWHKQEGDAVRTGDVLMDVETDKATLELNSYHDGTLAKILIGDGGTAPVGTSVGVLALPGEDLSAVARAAGDGAVAAPVAAPRAPAAPTAPTAPAAPTAPTAPAVAAAEVKASPLARVMAEQAGVDLLRLAGRGSGPGGRIVRRDVETAAQRGAAAPAAPPAPAAPAAPPAPAAPAAAAPPAAPGAPAVVTALAAAAQGFEDRELSRMRQAIARNMTLSKPGAPHIYLTIDVEMDAALALRRQLNDVVGDDERAKLSVNDLVTKAAALALRKVPELNAWYLDETPPKVRSFRRIDLGIAVPVEGGLVVPVLRAADAKTLGQLAAESKEIYERVRAGKPRADDFTGATFTTSNLGMFGIDEFQAILNPPQAGILAVGAATPKAVVRDGEPAIRTMMRVTLSSDHRVVDGVTSARYLQEFKRLLESPLSLAL